MQPLNSLYSNHQVIGLSHRISDEVDEPTTSSNKRLKLESSDQNNKMITTMFPVRESIMEQSLPVSLDLNKHNETQHFLSPLPPALTTTTTSVSSSLESSMRVNEIQNEDQDFVRFCNGRYEIYISKQTWTEIKKGRQAKEAEWKDIAEKINQFIAKYHIPYPYRIIKEEEIWSDFKKLNQYDFQQLIKQGNLNFKHDYFGNFDPNQSHTNPYQHMYILKNKVGLIAADFFQQEVRLKVKGTNVPGVYFTWHGEDHHRIRILKRIFNYTKQNEINSASIRKLWGESNCLSVQFKPSILGALIYTLEKDFSLDPSSSWKILDPCSGWGDRLIAALAHPKVSHYTGIDPNTQLIPGYQKTQEFFQGFLVEKGSNKSIHMISKPAEDMTAENYPPAIEYDLVFTSPPYFDKERYCDEPTQSYKRYIVKGGYTEENLKNWHRKFLCKMLRNSWEHLKVGGFLAINISDIKRGLPSRSKNKQSNALKSDAHSSQENVEQSGSSQEKKMKQTIKAPTLVLCASMNQYIKDILQGQYLGCIGIEMGSRGRGKKNGISVEPLWIWRKISTTMQPDLEEIMTLEKILAKLKEIRIDRVGGVASYLKTVFPDIFRIQKELKYSDKQIATILKMTSMKGYLDYKNSLNKPRDKF